VECQWIPPTCSKCTSFGHLPNQCPAKTIWIPKDTGEEVVVLKAHGENIALHLEHAQHMSGVLAGEESSDSVGASPVSRVLYQKDNSSMFLPKMPKLVYQG